MCRFVEFNRSDIQKLNDKFKHDPPENILCNKSCETKLKFYNDPERFELNQPGWEDGWQSVQGFAPCVISRAVPTS